MVQIVFYLLQKPFQCENSVIYPDLWCINWAKVQQWGQAKLYLPHKLKWFIWLAEVWHWKFTSASNKLIACPHLKVFLSMSCKYGLHRGRSRKLNVTNQTQGNRYPTKALHLHMQFWVRSQSTETNWEFWHRFESQNNRGSLRMDDDWLSEWAKSRFVVVSTKLITTRRNDKKHYKINISALTSTLK